MLKQGVAVEREIAGGQTDEFGVEVKAGQFLHVVAEQKGVDVVLSIVDPKGKVLRLVNGPIGSFNPEPASLIAVRTGRYRVQVTRTGQLRGSGRYAIALTDLRTPAPEDYKRIEAEVDFSSALSEAESSNKDSLQKAADHFEHAASVWDSLHDRYQQALCLHWLGRIYYSQGANQKALEMFTQALTLRREIGDRAGEALTLNNTGLAYAGLGDKQKALDFYLQALQIELKVGNGAKEILILNNLASGYADVGDNPNALKYYKQALEIEHSLGDTTSETTTLLAIGNVYWISGDTQKALESFQQALPLTRAMGSQAREASTLGAIAFTYSRGGDKRKALQFFQQALALWHTTSDRLNEATLLMTMADDYLAVGDRQNRLQSLQHALSLWNAIGDRKRQAVTLIFIGTEYSDLGDRTKALQTFDQALAIARDIGDQMGQALTLAQTGNIYSKSGEKEKATECFDKVVVLLPGITDEKQRGLILNMIGTGYSIQGDRVKAVQFFDQALPLLRDSRDTSALVEELNNMGRAYVQWDNRKALEYLEEAHRLELAAGDHRAEIPTLQNIGLAYAGLGDARQAVRYYEQALPLVQAQNDPSALGSLLTNLGVAYLGMGEPPRALDYLQRALSASKEAGDGKGLAHALVDIGNVYLVLGDGRKAMEYYAPALPLLKASGDDEGTGRLLYNMGVMASWAGADSKALELFEMALPLRRKSGDRDGEAATLNTIGSVYSKRGDDNKAIEYYHNALAMGRLSNDPVLESASLAGLGTSYQKVGKSGEALQALFHSLKLARTITNDPDLPAQVSVLLSDFWVREKNLSLAIFFAKDAVNHVQSIRRNIQGMDKELQHHYLASTTLAYRKLADLLLAEGRVPAAEEVLGMLKEQEFKEFTRGAAPVPAVTRTAPLTASEQRAESILAQGLEWQELRDVNNRNPQQQARYEELSNALNLHNKTLESFWQSLQSALPANDARGQIKFEASSTQKLLKKMPAGTVVVYALVLDDKLDLIVVEPSTMVEKSVAVKRDELADTVEQLRESIKDRKSGPALLDPAHRLYEWLVAPIADELQGAQAKTIAWSLDGVLRYIPVNVLYDGQRYLIERYDNVTYNPADTAGLATRPEIATWKALGMGVSKQYEKDLNPLPAVPGELRTIVRDQQDKQSHGPLPGRILLDDAFTEQALERELEQHYPLVHIASHFVMGLGTDDSYLLLGGKDSGGQGYRLLLSDVASGQNVTFEDTALLVLSACDTAMSKGEADGKEVDSLAAIGRERGAGAVLASLWDVNDASTGRLMADFYQRWSHNGSLTKADALRQAQLALLKGAPTQAGNGRMARGANLVKAPDDPAQPAQPPYSHPYYWAPFILMGNWQ